MSYILATTDFSPISQNAVLYAAALAAQNSMSVVLFHSFSFPAMVNDGTIPGALIDDTRKDAEKHIEALAQLIVEKHPTLNLSSVVVYGTFADSLNDYVATAGKPLLVVMGNSNTTDDSVWFFSTLRDASHQLKLPLLAVPQETTYTHTARTCLAYDTHTEQHHNSLSLLSTLCVDLKSELHVLNVQPEGNFHDYQTVIDDSTQNRLAKAHPKYHFVYNESVDIAIQNFCIENDINWLVLLHQEYSFIQSLIHKSHTKSLASSLTIPILILH